MKNTNWIVALISLWLSPPIYAVTVNQTASLISKPAKANSLPLNTKKRSEARPVNVTFVSPAPRAEGFWQTYEDVMLSAAWDLAINLNVVHSDDIDRFSHIEAIERTLKYEEKPDFMVTLFREGTTLKMLELLQQHDVAFFGTNSDIPDDLRRETDEPRKRFKNWIGHIKPDDFLTGQRLAEVLIEAAKARRPQSNNLNILAITGSRDSPAVYLRNGGLKAAVKGAPESQLLQIVFSDWRFSTVREMAPRLMARYPQADVIWCANDELAGAASLALRELDLPYPPLIGGIDWSHRGVISFESGDFVTSVGGHIIEGGIILALLRDYVDGHDFQTDLGTNITMQMDAFTEGNFAIIKPIILQHDWAKMDFTLLSKSLSGEKRFWANNYVQIIENIVPKTESSVSE